MGGFMTSSELAKFFRVRGYVFNYAVKLHGPEPALRVGTTRLWRQEDLDAIRASLDKTAEHSNRDRTEAVSA
jgi:hypothetical protein